MNKMNLRFFLTFLFAAMLTVLANQSLSCSVPPTKEQADRALKGLIDRADYVVIGQISRVTKRRWGPDDQLGLYEQTLQQYEVEGRDLFGYQQNLIEFSNAEAGIITYWSLRDDGIDSGKHRAFGRGMDSEIFIDLLQPFSVAGHGLCLDFPRTCPFDIQVGTYVAAAIYNEEYGPFSAYYCLVLDRIPSPEEREMIASLRADLPASEVIWPLIERYSWN